MKPRLYSPETTTFTTNGIGVLSDAISCRAFPAFGEDEIRVKYPLTGTHYADIRLRSILVVKPDPFRDPQPYRVYKITKPMSGTVTIYARHIAYDLSGIVVTPFNASSASETIWRLKNNAVTSCPFSFQTDVSAGRSFSVTAPSTIWSVMGGREGSILDVFGGEYQFDGYTVHLWNHMGSDRGVSIRYGKNLTSLEQDENCANCYTGVAPYWLDSQSGEIVTAPGTVVSASGSYGYTRILPLDLTDKFQEKPSVGDLLAMAQKYMTDNKIGEPAVSWKVEFVQLEKTVEYKGMALLERISLGDTVHVEFPLMGVSATARAVSAEYDCLLEHYVSVTLGSVRQSIANTIVSQQKEIQKKPSMSVVQTAMSKLTDTILGAKGGAVRLLDTDGDGSPDELYIADNKDPAQAVKVWRYNYEGWACSQSGYEGPFVMGATLNDGLLASFVTAANLVAGTIQSADGETFFLDLDNSILEMKAVNALQDRMTELSVRADGISAEISSQKEELGQVKTSMAEIKASSEEVTIQVQKIVDNGVNKVSTGLGLTISDSSVDIQRPGSEMTNSLDDTGMYVIRGKGTGQESVMLQANANGVVATDVTVRNYLIISHARFEDYSDGTDHNRTACFYV